MKFLAILRDSVRETLDNVVFYVMVGASALLILLTVSMTVEPTGNATEYLTWASLPLNIDLQEGEVTNVSPKDPFAQLADRLNRDQYRVVKVEATDGKADHPASRYRVHLTGKFRDDKTAEAIRANPEGALEFLRERFGNLAGARMVEVADVRLADPLNAEPSEVAFVLETRPTAVTYRLWPHRVSLFFGAFSLTDLLAPAFEVMPFSEGKSVPLGIQLFLLEGFFVNSLGGWVTVIVSIVITASFVPNMLRKGTLDLLLAKPIHRPTLLIYKYIGGLTFILLNTTLAIGGVWLVVGLKTGIWSNGFLLSIPVLTFYFAVLYSVSVLFGVLTRSAISAILLTCLVWLFLSIVGHVYNNAELQVSDEGRRAHHETWQRARPPGAREKYKDDGLTPEQRRARESGFIKGVRALHSVLPRTADLNALTQRALVQDLLFANQVPGTTLDPTPINWRESLLVSLAFIAVMLGLACWRFSVKDY